MIMAVSSLLALAGQELFYATGIGINLGIFTILVLSALALLDYKGILRLKPVTRWLGIPCLISSAGLILNDSRGLDSLNITVLFFAFGLASVLESAESLPSLSRITFLSPLYSACFGLVGFTVPFLPNWTEVFQKRKSGAAPGL